MFAHLRTMSRLTLSTFVSRVGLHLLFVGDSVAIGRYAIEQLAWFGAAAALTSVLFVLAQGLLIGCLVASSAARARGDSLAIGDIWRAGCLYGVSAGLVCAAICFAGPTLLTAGSKRMTG